MKAPLILASLVSLAMAEIDATVGAAEPVQFAPMSKEQKADSAWNRESWAIEASYRNGIGWGDLRDAEEDMANAVDVKVLVGGESSEPMILLQNYSLGLGVWHGLGKRMEVGMAYEHTWSFVTAGQGGLDLLLSSHALSARARYWVVRRAQWQIGPKLGIGPCWGTLTRYGLEQGATYRGSAGNRSDVEAVLSAGSQELSASGLRMEAGLGMEVRIVPQFSIGGALQAVRTGMSISDNDPIGSQLRSIGIPYPMDPVQWEVGLDLHAAYRF